MVRYMILKLKNKSFAIIQLISVVHLRPPVVNTNLKIAVNWV